VLDSYCIAVSLLNHKKNLKVFQIWHALGLFKHFGYTAIGKKEGSSEFTAKAMRMHRNYDYVICSGDDLVSDIAAAYDISPSKVIPLGLPRMDYLLSETVREHNYDKIIGAYPYIDNGRKNILYVPTFRKTAENKFMLLVDNIDFREYNLIVKLHDGKELVYVDKEICGTGESAFGMDFLHIADAVITDYSAIIFEAALLKKPIYLYCYDYASYMENRGLYIDYMSLPMVISEDIKTIINAVEQDDFDKNKISAFLKRNIPYCNIDITKTLCSMFVQAAEGKNVFDVEYIVKFDKLL
jgi:Putative glycosyl/glycerophosphate transferases involved in teichoic acid biosynthesis TagF/TagB/EpsJ/RodC